MLNQQKKATSSQTSPYSAKWKWEKRHVLLIVALVLCVLWYFIPKLKTSPVLQKGITHLSTIGGLLFAADSVIKLAQ
ncbi:hypothetical protein [endosymbiont GvMRE of Glomus versiforme]|uniref:hypothetical protein n=1 Tax=endosymbiont GvMRE of Glomus versiforme TaxID=2039283 RepID=UPI000EB8283B|nr:hypothetical protein [endosymbiont GvMRE of Glomus versiforme]RHZ36723.1 hypothetical protein GvMRE_I2g410 [endosymbiont GvMRE of Glomus versiforme]